MRIYNIHSDQPIFMFFLESRYPSMKSLERIIAVEADYNKVLGSARRCIRAQGYNLTPNAQSIVRGYPTEFIGTVMAIRPNAIPVLEKYRISEQDQKIVFTRI